MSLCEVHWQSDVLRKKLGMYVILPDRGRPPFPTFYLLHGLSDDYTTWLRRTRIEWYVRDQPLIVVMPDGFRGFYTDNEQGPAFAQYVGVEIPAFIERNFPARAERSGRFVGGLSMGGYGALRIALGFPDRFASATSHSGALVQYMAQHLRDTSPLAADEAARIFGSAAAGTSHDLAFLAERAKRAGQLPRLRVDCGAQDVLLESNRGFHEDLKRLQISHEYAEFPGAHTWDYWDEHIREAIAFHMRRE